MNAPHIANPIPRRRFLRGLGVTLGLPLLECMTPVFSRAAAGIRERFSHAAAFD